MYWDPSARKRQQVVPVSVPSACYRPLEVFGSGAGSRVAVCRESPGHEDRTDQRCMCAMVGAHKLQEGSDALGPGSLGRSGYVQPCVGMRWLQALQKRRKQLLAG